MYKLDLEKAEEPEIKLPTFIISWSKQSSFRKIICFCFIAYTKAFDCVGHSNRLWKILKEVEIPPYLSTEKSVCGSRSTVRTRHGTQTGSKLGKEYIKAVLSSCLFNLYEKYII